MEDNTLPLQRKITVHVGVKGEHCCTIGMMFNFPV